MSTISNTAVWKKTLFDVSIFINRDTHFRNGNRFFPTGLDTLSTKMNKVLSLRAPAKINLYLKVINRREDGYHNLLSLMHMIGLYDQIILKEREQGLTLRVQNSPLLPDHSNLVLQAATLLQKEMISSGYPSKGADITLKKEIPLSAGLAGGSSDAAAALIGLNRLWSLNWTKEKLAGLSEQLGSDLPFFFDGPAAWVFGRGEQVEPVYPELKKWLVLVNPGIAVSTTSVFEAFSAQTGLTKTGTPINITGTERRPEIEHILQNPQNDLEIVTLKRFPQLKTIKGRLKEVGGSTVLMSGSGPSLFAFFGDQKKANAAARQIRQMYQDPLVKVWAVPLLQASPFSEFI